MRTSLAVTATLLTGLTLTATMVMRKVRRLEKDFDERWAAFASGPPEVTVDLKGTPIQVDYIAKELRTHYIHQT